MRKILAAFILAAAAFAAAGAADDCKEPRPPSYQPFVSGPRRDVEAAAWEVKFQREQYAKTIQALKIDEAKPILPECVLPVQVALQYWAANARQDLATYKGIIPDREYDMMQWLTMLDFINLRGNAGEDKVLTWRINWFRLRDECEKAYARKAKEAIPDPIIKTEGGVLP